MEKRSKKYKNESILANLQKQYHGYCAYCSVERATTIDHIIPVSYVENNDIANLAPCCLWCNLHASNKMFENFDEKKEYLQRLRLSKDHYTQTICTTCYLPYQIPHMSFRMFECPDCNKDLLTTNQMKEWRKFEKIVNWGIDKVQKV